MDRSEPSATTRAGPANPTRVRRATTLLLGGMTLATGLGYLGGWWWVFDLFAHFVPTYLLGAAVLLALAAFRQWWTHAGWALALGLLHLVRVLPLYGWVAPPPSDRPALRVVSFNLHVGNPQAGAAAKHVAALQPDVVALFEVSRTEIEQFESVLRGYEMHALPRRDPFGIAVFCRLPLRDATIESFGPSWTPAVRLQATFEDRPITIAAIHPPPPVGADLSHARDQILGAVSHWAAEHDDPVLVVGDLNATPWSSVMRRILRNGPLVTSQRFGLQPTWPRWLGPLGLPIDHALHSPTLRVVEREVGPSFGSDHRMLRVDLVVDPAPPSAP